MTTAHASAYQAYSGTLGAPVGSYLSLPGGSYGPGGGQRFAKGSIFSSAAGAFPIWGPIRSEYIRLQAERGTLGWPTAAPVCAGNLCSQTFQGGTVFQVSASKANTVFTEYLGVYLDNNAELGLPMGSYGSVASAANGNGGGQRFANGSIFSSSAGVYAMWGSVRAEYMRVQAYRGALGFPTSAQECGATDCTQNYQGGTITK